MPNSLRPISEPFDPEVAAILSTYPNRDGYVLKLFRVFANSVRFLRKGTVNLLDRDSPISMRLREIVILRVTANNHCEYEWGVHVGAFATHVGLTDEQVQATRLDTPDASCWTDQEALALRVVDEVCATGSLQPRTLARFQAQWDVAQQLEILALCGNYHTISFVANVAALDSEDFAATFPR